MADPRASSTASSALPPPPDGAVPLAMPDPLALTHTDGARVDSASHEPAHELAPDETTGAASRPFLPGPGTGRSRRTDWVDIQPAAADPSDALRSRLAERTDAGPWLPPIGGASAVVQAPVPPGSSAVPAPTIDGHDVSTADSEPPGADLLDTGRANTDSLDTASLDTASLDTDPLDTAWLDSDPLDDGPLDDGPLDDGPLDDGPDTGPAVGAPDRPGGPGDAPTAEGDGTDPRRAAAVLGALVAVALGFAAVLWFTRSDDTSTGASTPDTTITIAPPGTVAPTGTAPATTVAASAPPDTAAPDTTTLVMTTPDTTAADTTAPEFVPTTVADLPISVPADAVPFTDPAGWTLAAAPTWAALESDGSTAWLTGESSPTFADRVDVTVETVDAGVTLDEYATALWEQVVVGFPDATLVDRVRVVGDDGVRREVITWTGTLPGGPPRAFVQAVAVQGSRAATATLTTEPDRVRPQALLAGPYLASVRPA